MQRSNSGECGCTRVGANPVPAVKSVGMGDMSQDVVVSSTRTAGRHGVGAVGSGSPTGVGAVVDDPHRWLEDIAGEDALAWARGHNERTDAELSGDRFERMRVQALEVFDTDDSIPSIRRRGEFLYNFWRDAANPRGLWRRTTLDGFRTDTPDWDVLIDVDALAAAEDENWVWHGAAMIKPDCSRAMIDLSRGGADATEIREFDMTTRQFVPDGFTIPAAKTSNSSGRRGHPSCRDGLRRRIVDQRRVSTAGEAVASRPAAGPGRDCLRGTGHRRQR